MTLVKLLASEAPAWIVAWYFRHEPRQIDYVTGAWLHTSRGLFGVDPSLRLSSREAERRVRELEASSR